MNLTASQLNKAENVFLKNAWAISPDAGNSNALFNRFCASLDRLDDSAKELIFELTAKFLRLEMATHYLSAIKAAIAKIDEPLLENINTIYFLPMIRPEETMGGGKKIKPNASTLFILGWFRSSEIKELPKFKNISFKIHINYSGIPTTFNVERSIIFLVDDYCGTGKTALDALDEFKRCYGFVNIKKLHMLFLVAQEAGVAEIEKLGIRVFSGYTRKKAISDELPVSEVDRAKMIMRKIEMSMKIPAKYKFGYKESEALVAFDTVAPNNTFPFYWFDVELEKRKIKALFSRVE